MLRLPRFYYEGEGTGGSPPPAPANPAAVDLQHTERITRIEGSLEAMPTEFGRQMDDLRSDVFRRVDEVQSEVSDRFGSVMEKLEGLTPKPPETPPTPTDPPAPATPPNVDVTPPAPETRKVRRGGRKVTKKVKKNA